MKYARIYHWRIHKKTLQLNYKEGMPLIQTLLGVKGVEIFVKPSKIIQRRVRAHMNERCKHSNVMKNV